MLGSHDPEVTCLEQLVASGRRETWMENLNYPSPHSPVPRHRKSHGNRDRRMIQTKSEVMKVAWQARDQREELGQERCLCLMKGLEVCLKDQ